IGAEQTDDAGLEVAAVIALTQLALRRLDALLHVLDVALCERTEERLLRREVIKQSALADPCGLGDDVQGHARGPDVADDALGSVENAIANGTQSRGFDHVRNSRREGLGAESLTVWSVQY